MSVFAFQMSRHCLHVRATPGEILQIPGAGTEADDWLFFDDAGRALRLQREGEEASFLWPWASCASCSLPQILYDVHEVQGIAPLNTLEGVRKHIGL